MNTLAGFEGCVDRLFNGLNEPVRWLHDIRDAWRLEQLKRVAVNRPDFDVPSME